MTEPPIARSPADEVGWLRLPTLETDAYSLFSRMDEELAAVEGAAEAGALRVVAVTGEELGPLPSRPELEELRGEQQADAGVALSLLGQRVLRRLERLPVPTVAVLAGPCLGTGLQIALACSHRVVREGVPSQLGLPEIRTGRSPAFGGTVRLPRLVGRQAALELLLTGRAVGVHEALRLGLLDARLPTGDLEASLLEWVATRARPASAPRAGKRGVAARLLEDTAPGRRLLLPRLARRLLPRVAYAAPAPQRVLELVAEATTIPLDQAFHREAEVYGELAAGERARALAYAARAPRLAVERLSGAQTPVEQVAIVGAGAAGSDLAFLLTAAEVPVRLRDAREALAAGRRRMLRRFALEVESGRASEREVERRVELVAGGAGWGGFGTADLAVVTGGGGAGVVRETLREVEQHTREGCALAVVTQHLTAAEVAEGLAHPERLLCLRFATPIDRFPVVEIAAAPDTVPEVVASCAHLLRRTGRVPLRVADHPGGVSGRLLALLFAEALRLADEGAAIDLVDRIAEDFGFLVGPFRRIDSLGADAARQLLEQLAERLGARFLPAPLLARVAESGEEFHRYQDGRPAGANPVLPSGIRSGGQGMVEVIRNRLVLVLVNEAALIREEGVASVETIEAASLLGVGFPRARGGVLYHADQVGLPRAVELLHDYARRFGERFAPVALLQRAAEAGDSLTGHRSPTVL